MKLFSALVILTLSVPTFALERPATLVCQRPSLDPASAAPVEIKLSAFDTAAPVATGLDGGLLDPLHADAAYTGFTFSNECDNYYSFLFFSDDLARLAQGKISRVTGLLNFSAAGENDGRIETVSVSCTQP